jgi:hypothetical protein
MQSDLLDLLVHQPVGKAHTTPLSTAADTMEGYLFQDHQEK